MKKVIIIVGVILLIGVVGFLGYQRAGQKSETLESYYSDSSSVMYFYSPLCSTCQELKPILKKLSDEGLKVKGMDIQKNPEYIKQYKVFDTPTFVSTKDLNDRIGGQLSIETLREWLKDRL